MEKRYIITYPRWVKTGLFRSECIVCADVVIAHKAKSAEKEWKENNPDKEMGFIGIEYIKRER